MFYTEDGGGRKRKEARSKADQHSSAFAFSLSVQGLAEPVAGWQRAWFSLPPSPASFVHLLW